MSLTDSPRVSRVLGTAGHIDHGKTTLIHALTGVDTDRLPEEKERGITIELGFAPLDLGDGTRLSVVDVPGHEKLVRTMVAGASGIDLLLLVVAADEGVMPQTREHVAICELLGIERGAVALTKCELVGDDIVELATAEIQELLAETHLAQLPILPVSARSGVGIDALRGALLEAAQKAPPRVANPGAPRLPVDRVFAMKGFGTVVTGTLSGGAFCQGAEVELFPSGKKARVRGLQSHGQSEEEIQPGVRCALNLQGLEVRDIARGEVVSLPGALAPTESLDAEITWLAASPLLEDSTAVEFLSGTSERRGRLSLIGQPELAPGERSFARIHIDEEPVTLLPGDRFVLRGFARTELGGATLGGGVVLDVAPLRRRRSDPELKRQLESLARDDLATGIAVRIRRAGLAGISAQALRHQTGLPADALDGHLDALAQQGSVCATPTGIWLGDEHLALLRSRMRAALEAFHREEPLRPGMPRAALLGTAPDNAARGAAELALKQLEKDGTVVLEEDRVRSANHQAQLSTEDEALAARILAASRAAALEPPKLNAWAQELGVGETHLRELLAHLEREGKLVATRGDLWFDRAAVGQLREKLVAYLKEHGAIDTPAYKELIGTSRRTAVPLMELFDGDKVTLRRGEERILRGTQS